PFGITVLDAVLFSCPVVATKNTGALELFDEGITIVEPQDSTALGDTVVYVLENRDEFEKKAEYTKKIIETKDFWKSAGQSVAELCRDM
ncbi:MAG: glycosyltransferase, partial [Candidatus Aenigmarchaeota archaeon]|nr:glycosyltransferase [Candidatus Aenigmarchaeota archaeon]